MFGWPTNAQLPAVPQTWDPSIHILFLLSHLLPAWGGAGTQFEVTLLT